MGIGEQGAASRWVVILCWVAVALDGFDLVVLEAVRPALLEYQEWGLTVPQIGVITSYGLFGILLGAGLAVPWSFYAFSVVGLLGAVFIAVVPRAPAGRLWLRPRLPDRVMCRVRMRVSVREELCEPR